MKFWTYQELVDTIKSAYVDGLDQHRSKALSICAVSDDFYYFPEDEFIIENLISITQTLKLSIEELGGYFEGMKHTFDNQKLLLNDGLLQKELTPSEIILLKQSINNLHERLNSSRVISIEDYLT